MSTELPEGWASVTLGHLIDGFEAGRNLRAQGRRAGPGEFGVLKISAVTWGAFRPEEHKALLPGDIPKSHERVRENDLLITRANTSTLVGAAVLVGQDHPMLMLPDKILRLKVNRGIVQPRFLLQALRTQAVRDHFESNATGTSDSMRNLAQPKLAAAPISLAPLREQERIVNNVEALLEQVNQAKARLDRVTLILKRFRQSVLAAGCSGELTGDATAHTWEETDIQSCGRVGTGSTPLRATSSFYAKVGTPWVTSAATSTAVVLNAEEFVTKAAIAAHRLKVYPKGTILVAMYGEGKTRGQVSELGIEATINQAMAAIVVDENRAERQFIKLVLQANYLQMRTLAEGGNQPNLNLSKIKEFPLRLPPLAVQRTIVSRVNGLLALSDAIGGHLVQAAARAERLPQSILSKAFSGELVPTEAELARIEGRSYETAEELLKRMTAPTAVATSKGKARRSPHARNVG